MYYLLQNDFYPENKMNQTGDINVKVDMSNYLTKADLKNPTGNNTSKLAAVLINSFSTSKCFVFFELSFDWGFLS